MHMRRIAAAVVIAASLAAAAPRPVVLTTDCGADMDDQWALAHLVLSPEFDIRAVVTTHTGKHQILAAPAAETSARIAREVLQRMPLRARPTVIPGSSIALTSRSPLPNPGVERIISESKTFTRDRRLTVLVIGAATDTASALMADPTVADRIEIIAMGFKGWAEGGDEFNIINDPLAWRVILDSGVPVTVGDGETTKRDLSLTSERAHSILDPAGAPGRYLAGLLDDWFAKHSDVVARVTGNPKVWPVWDEVTVAHMLGFTKAEQRARPKMLPNLSFDHSPKQGVVTWVTSINGDQLWRDLASRIQRAQTNQARLQ
jgi:inosine-uridine nucleoside N-ribohydrolase